MSLWGQVAGVLDAVSAKLAQPGQHFIEHQIDGHSQMRMARAVTDRNDVDGLVRSEISKSVPSPNTGMRDRDYGVESKCFLLQE